MAPRRLVGNEKLGTLSLLVMVIVASLLVGVLSGLFSPLWFLGGFGALACLFLVTMRPEIGLLAYLVLTSTIIDNSRLPRLPIGIGKLFITDIILLALLALILARRLLDPRFTIVRTPLDLPLICFVGIACLSTFMAIKQGRVTFTDSLAEVRASMGYLTFFVVTNLLRKERQLRILLRGMLLLATLVAVAMIAQYALGTTVSILPGRVETLSTAGTVSYGVIRVLPPGQSLVLVASISLAVLLIQSRNAPQHPFGWLQLGTIGLSVVLTFNRSFWVACALALLLVGFLVSARDKVRYLQSAFWTILTGTLVIGSLLVLRVTAAEQLINGAMIRISSLVSGDTVNEASLRYRYIEDGYAYPQIASHPFVGLGLGADYRPLDSRIDRSGPGLTYYIHNGHLWVMLKAGLTGYFFFMWFLLLFVKRAVQNWQKIPDLFLRGMVLSSAVAVIGVLVASLVNPIIAAPYWSPVIGIIAGATEAILRMSAERHFERRSTASQI